MLTSLGVLEEPLGNTRLHVARLVASLLYTSSSSHAVVAQELCRLNTMDLLLVSSADSQADSRMLSQTFDTVAKIPCFFFFFPGLVFQIHLEQLPPSPSGALRRSHPPSLRSRDETPAGLSGPGQTKASCGRSARAVCCRNSL